VGRLFSRESIHSGHLQQLIDQRAVVGATSNPTIFQKAMTDGDTYDEQLRDLGPEPDGARESWGKTTFLGAGSAGHSRCL